MKLVVVSIALVACGSKDPPPASPPANVVIAPDAAPAIALPDAPEDPVVAVTAKMTGFAEAMCACRDKTCADTVQEDMMKWSTKMAAEAGEHPIRKASEGELEVMTGIGQRYGECMVKAMNP